MDERDYQTYVSLFSNMSNFMRKPNLIIHLDVKPEESLERIKMRYTVLIATLAHAVQIKRLWVNNLTWIPHQFI